MYKKVVYPVIVILIISLCSFHALTGTVTGSINPSDAGGRVLLFSSSDTVTTRVDQGKFLLTGVKAGSYTLLVEGQPPYRNSVKDGIVVVDGQPTDAGVIEMQK